MNSAVTIFNGKGINISWKQYTNPWDPYRKFQINGEYDMDTFFSRYMKKKDGKEE